MRFSPASILLSMLFILASCFKEDEIVKPHEQGDAKTVLIDSSMYDYQCFFDLDSAIVSAVRPNHKWVIALEASEQGWRININSGAFYGVYPTGLINFNEVTPVTSPDQYIFDASSGHPDSSAFNRWLNRSVIPFNPTGEIFLIGKYDGIKYNPEWMIKFLSYTDTSYTFQFAPPGMIPVQKTIKKDPAYNKMYYTFSGGGSVLSVEPEKNSWDIQFTQYGTILFTEEGVPTPYFVRGVLSNPSGVGAASDSVRAFSDVDYQFANGLSLNFKDDAIGYDWKEVKVDFNSGTAVYIARSNVTYIIRDKSGYLFKLRFIDFYNNKDKEGYPTFELQKL